MPLFSSDPARCVLPDGHVLMVYKAVANYAELLRMGVSRSENPEGPYQRLLNRPVLHFDATSDHVEDAYVWWSGNGFELIMKDMKGGICGERGGGIHATSPNGVDWTLSDPPPAYSRTIRIPLR